MENWRSRQVANALNGSTLLGLAIARVGGARLTRGDRGLWHAEGYRLKFPVATAFTVGDVVLSPLRLTDLERHSPGVLAHEERHADQYAACLGLPFLPLYVVASAWSWLRTSNFASANVFEVDAGLDSGGYERRARDNAGARRIAGAVRKAATRPGRRGAKG